ncbi:MAG: iron-containing alcohol dehydrogenase [Spirochaeta sp.]
MQTQRHFQFSFRTNPHVISGPGCFSRLPELISGLPGPQKSCRRVLLVRGGESLRHTPQWSYLLRELTQRGVEIYEQAVHCEPSVELIDGAVQDYRHEEIDAVAAIGGGSVLDAGKAIAAMLCVRGSVQDFLDDVGDRSHPGMSLPVAAVPTTAGTGSEATKNAVICGTGKNGFKKSLRHDNFVPNIAVLDAELTVECPPDITAACGLDACTQLIESYTSSRAVPLTDALAVSGLKELAWALPLCCMDDPHNLEARQAMLYAAYLSGVCLANAGLGVVHGAAGVIGGKFDVPHGIVCGNLLGPATRMNIGKIQDNPQEYRTALAKYSEVGSILTQHNNGDVLESLLLLLDSWLEEWEIPGLGSFGIQQKDIQSILEKTGLKNNPVELSRDDIHTILASAL